MRKDKPEVRRLVILAEGCFSIFKAKTAVGVIRYSPNKTVAVIDSTHAGKTVQDVLGFGGEIPIVASVSDSLQFQPDTLLIGIAPTGGQLPPHFREEVQCAIEHGLDVWSGLHEFLSEDPELSHAAKAAGVTIWDVRKPRTGLVVASGRALHTRAFVVLTVGTDCNSGKMTTALELEKFAQARGWEARFVATGQTGILIEGKGTPLDAVPGDFMAGEVESLVMEHDAEGADVIFVEGQGALLHPGFGPVTLALMLGAMPDAMLLCHVEGRTTYRPDHTVPLPPMSLVIQTYEALLHPYKAPRIRGICLNTVELTDAEAKRAIDQRKAEFALPVCDPVRTGVAEIWEALEPLVRQKRSQAKAAKSV